MSAAGGSETGRFQLPLRDRHREAGARMAAPDGVEVPRHYGDAATEYRAATQGAALFDRSDRARLLVAGRDPAAMMGGILTGTVPGSAAAGEAEGILRGRGHYSAVLTPKGRMVTDLRIFPVAGDSFLLDLPRAGLPGLLDHFRRFLPPRLARAEDRSGELAMLTLAGPGAAALASREALEGRVGEDDLLALEEDGFVELAAGAAGAGEADGAGSPTGGGGWGPRVIRCGEVWPPTFDLLGETGWVTSLWERLRGAGAVPAGRGGWETLRVEAGRPAYGPDMDDGTIPVEAGIHHRAIDYEKGCYTGQEVVVMIRDRGRVNRHLRGLLLGSEPTPSPGTELYIPGRERPGGEVRTAVQSPRFGQTIALGYLRRELEVPGTARLGRPDGPAVEVREVTAEGWVPAESDEGLPPPGDRAPSRSR